MSGPGSNIWAPRGEQGPPGPAGPEGPQGPIGPPGPGAAEFAQFVLDLKNSSDPLKGVSLVGGAARVVNTMVELLALPKTGIPVAIMLNYTANVVGGGGVFKYDSTDTTSLSNGGTIVVAADGGRWKRAAIGEVNVTHFGAVVGGVVDCYPAVNAMINAGIRKIIYPEGVYYQSQTVTIPQATDIEFRGAGFRLTKIIGNNAVGYPLFNYQRASGQGGSTAVWKDMGFQWSGTLRQAGSRAIKYFGFSDVASDNWFRTIDCAFYNFEAARHGKWSGQVHSENDYFQGNGTSHLLERGASFWYLTNNMSFDATFVNAIDTIADAFSNGLILQNCHNITATSANMIVQNWQAVFIDECGFDLGSGGTGALIFTGCQDVYIDKSFISSNNSTTRAGVVFNGSHSSKIDSCTIVNNSVGVSVSGTAGIATKIVVDSCKFDGNATNDIVLVGNAKACKMVNNHHSKQMARTGTAFEVYGNTTGTDYNTIIGCTFAGTTYSVVMGANSVGLANIFGTGV